MGDIEVLIRIVLRQPLVWGTVLCLGATLAALAHVVTRENDWATWRRVVLGSACFAFALLPATTLARTTGSVSWRLPNFGPEGLSELLRPDGRLFLASPENILNVAMLMPFGFLAVAATQRVLAVVAVAAVAVVIVELVQGVTGLGTLEVPDILHNVAGAVVGALLARFAFALVPVRDQPAWTPAAK